MKYILVILLIMAVSFFGAPLKAWFLGESKQKDEYEMVKQYLLNESPLYGYNRPKLWIHSKYEYNSRKWKSFMSRSSYDLNQPYIYLTVKTIVNHCGDDFNVCLVDDDSFEKLLPGWDLDMASALDPMRTHLREIGMAQLVYYYGGMVVPNSLVCCRPLLPLFQEGIGPSGKQFFVCERPNKYDDMNHEIGRRPFVPDPYVMGAKKNCPEVLDYIKYLKQMYRVNDLREAEPLKSIPLAPNQARMWPGTNVVVDDDDKERSSTEGGRSSTEGGRKERSSEEASGRPDLDGPRGAQSVQAFFTNELEFTGEIAQYLLDQVKAGQITLIGGEHMGVKTRDRKVIALEDLMSDGFLNVDGEELYGLFIPGEELLTRPKHSWFAVMPAGQLLNSQTIVAKYIKVSMADSADNKKTKKSVVAL